MSRLKISAISYLNTAPLMWEQRPKAPTEAEAAANRAQAEAARTALKARAAKLKEVVLARVVDGHLPVKLDRVVAGTGLAAALDANTLPGAQRAATPPPITELPHTIGVGSGPDTFSASSGTAHGLRAPAMSTIACAPGLVRR